MIGIEDIKRATRKYGKKVLSSAALCLASCACVPLYPDYYEVRTVVPSGYSYVSKERIEGNVCVDYYRNAYGEYRGKRYYCTTGAVIDPFVPLILSPYWYNGYRYYGWRDHHHHRHYKDWGKPYRRLPNWYLPPRHRGYPPPNYYGRPYHRFDRLHDYVPPFRDNNRRLPPPRLWRPERKPPGFHDGRNRPPRGDWMRKDSHRPPPFRDMKGTKNPFRPTNDLRQQKWQRHLPPEWRR